MANVNKELVESINIRPIEAGDEALIEIFFDRMGGESRALFNRRDYNRRGVLKFCARPDPTRRYFIAERGGEMAGYFFFMDWNTMIPEIGIAVRDDLAGKGLGTHLMSRAIEMAKSAGKGGIRLTTHTANLRGQTLYESAGFTCCGLCKNGTELFYLLNFKAE